ncbi:MAG: peptide deformylase [Bacillota bacterium]
MAVQEVLMLGNQALRDKSKSVKEFTQETMEVITDLKDTLMHLQREKGLGRALAAPQIGYKQKIIYANLPAEEIVMVNPEIVDKSEEMMELWDSCFSFNVDFFVKVERHRTISVKYLDEDGEECSREFTDDLSELFQHEIDHLYGIMATDRMIDQQAIMMRSEWEKLDNDGLGM